MKTSYTLLPLPSVHPRRSHAGADAQRRYDMAYQQCMYAKGNQLPGYGHHQAPSSPLATGYPPPPSY